MTTSTFSRIASEIRAKDSRNIALWLGAIGAEPTDELLVGYALLKTKFFYMLMSRFGRGVYLHPNASYSFLSDDIWWRKHVTSLADALSPAGADDLFLHITRGGDEPGAYDAAQNQLLCRLNSVPGHIVEAHDLAPSLSGAHIAVVEADLSDFPNAMARVKKERLAREDRIRKVIEKRDQEAAFAAQMQLVEEALGRSSSAYGTW